MINWFTGFPPTLEHNDVTKPISQESDITLSVILKKTFKHTSTVTPFFQTIERLTYIHVGLCINYFMVTICICKRILITNNNNDRDTNVGTAMMQRL